MEGLHEQISSLAVSSVLNRDVKQFGKKFLIDGNDDTCWNSDQGDSQHITITFDKEVFLHEFHLQFQGGFSCKHLEVYSVLPNEELLTTFYPEDINIIQTFHLEDTTKASSKIRLKFLKSADFFGRIIVYHLKLFGKVQ